jgi:hypothetical protein
MTQCKVEWNSFDIPNFWKNLYNHVSEDGRQMISMQMINEFLQQNNYECNCKYDWGSDNFTLKECMIFSDEETKLAFVLEWS